MKPLSIHPGRAGCPAFSRPDAAARLSRRCWMRRAEGPWSFVGGRRPGEWGSTAEIELASADAPSARLGSHLPQNCWGRLGWGGGRGSSNGIGLRPRGLSPPAPLPQTARERGDATRRARRAGSKFIPSPVVGRGCGSQAAGEGPSGRRRVPVARDRILPSPRVVCAGRGRGRGLPRTPAIGLSRVPIHRSDPHPLPHGSPYPCPVTAPDASSAHRVGGRGGDMGVGDGCGATAGHPPPPTCVFGTFSID
jgi:hypothetical protein